MVVAIAALAAVALLAADVAGVTALRTYLIGKVDAQLQVGVPPPRFLDEPVRRGGFNPGPANHVYFFTGTGERVNARSDGEPDLGSFEVMKAHTDGQPFTVDADGVAWRVAVRTLPASEYLPDGGYVVAAISLSEVEDTQAKLLAINAAVTVLILLLIGFAAASLVRVGLRPLTRMEGIAEEIAGGDLSRRVDGADPHTEAGRLGAALNTMLVRIEGEVAARTESEQRLRQFLADASHELRTPLTSIQGFAELYRRGGAQPGPDLDDAMSRIEGEVGRMRVLVNDLMLLARLDEERPLESRPVDLLEVAADAVRDAHARVPTRFVHLDVAGDVNGEFEPVTIPGDEARIRQVVTNLVSNALQHTPDDAKVDVRVGRAVGAARAPRGPWSAPAATVGAELPADGAPDAIPLAVIEVQDTGHGMRPADASRVFERLYRADHSRARTHGGAGLGLSIVAAIVAAHGGQAQLWTSPGKGTLFRVLLPAGAGFPGSSEVV
jgi:two-component system OmpR family sensor kinase